MYILIASPIGFITNLSVWQAKFVIFCGTTLGVIAVLWAIVFLLFRPLHEHGIFAPLESLNRRISNLGLVLISAGVSYFSAFILKNIFRIGRPDMLNVDFTPLMKLTNYGFPSGHASFYSALAVSMFFVSRRAGIFLGLIALVVGAARILAGVHTPLDIIGGFLLGTLVAVVIDFTAQTIAKKRVAK